jgi:hypothetical protein
MTIPKRNKRRRRVKSPPLPQENKVEEIMKTLEKPKMDKMIRKCPYCEKETYSTRCNCGRITVINK